MNIKRIDNVATCVTDYYSRDTLETVALIPRTMFAHSDRIDILGDINPEDDVKEIIINNKKHILKNVIEEDDYFIFQLDEVE